jgi:hypothetical protein
LILTLSQFLAEKKGTTGTYAALKFDDASVKRIAQYVANNSIPNPLAEAKLHVTLLYSRVECVGFTSPGKLIEPIVATVKGFDVWANANGEGKALVERHLMLMKLYGATYDFPEYQPHFTISYNVPDKFDPQNLPEFDSALYLNHEYSKPLDLDWNKS